MLSTLRPSSMRSMFPSGRPSMRSMFSSRKPEPQRSGSHLVMDDSDIETLVEAPAYSQAGTFQAPSAAVQSKSPQHMTANDRMEAAFATHRGAASALSNANPGTQGFSRLGGGRRDSNPEASTACLFAKTRARFAKLARRNSGPSDTRAAEHESFLRRRHDMMTRVNREPIATEAATAQKLQHDWATQQQSQLYVGIMAQQAAAYAKMASVVYTGLARHIAEKSFAQQSGVRQFGQSLGSQYQAPPSVAFQVILMPVAPTAQSNYSAAPSQFPRAESQYRSYARGPGSAGTMFEVESARTGFPDEAERRPTIDGGEVVDRRASQGGPLSGVQNWINDQASQSPGPTRQDRE
jgi:hypothetical protein